MRGGTTLILLVGFGILILLIVFLVVSAMRGTEQIFMEVLDSHESYQRTSAALGTLQSDLYRASLLVRDYLLDPDSSAAAKYRQELLAIREAMIPGLIELDRLTGQAESARIQALRIELDAYWDSLEPVFEWSPAQKAARSTAFLEHEIVPRRAAVIAAAGGIDKLAARAFQREQDGVEARRRALRGGLVWILAVALTLSLAVAVFSIHGTRRLVARLQDQRERAGKAERELRRLSQQLVQAQEEERKSISRELHDQIGQMLTALRMELGNLERLHPDAPVEFISRLAESKLLAEKTLRAARDLSMGLRPSILDDLGLVPALQWQAREFSRRVGVPVTLDADGDLERLPEPICTCAYRVVQESLTNCARHARAASIRIAVHGGRRALLVTVQDDGVGFDAGFAAGHGLGLVGMEERIRKLGGRLTIASQPGKGTLVEVEIPLAGKEAA